MKPSTSQHRGKAIQPLQDCGYCSKPLPDLRHPAMKYCDSACRQGDRYQREHISEGIKCLDCKKIYKRVGSHVVQIHGYASTAEYMQEHGLMAKETHTKEHAAEMREKARNYNHSNLKFGEPNRYQKGGDHGEKLREFWKNRRAKAGYKEIGTSLDNRKDVSEDRGRNDNGRTDTIKD